MHVPFANIDNSLFREIISFTPLPFFLLCLCVVTDTVMDTPCDDNSQL